MKQIVSDFTRALIERGASLLVSRDATISLVCFMMVFSCLFTVLVTNTENIIRNSIESKVAGIFIRSFSDDLEAVNRAQEAIVHVKDEDFRMLRSVSTDEFAKDIDIFISEYTVLKNSLGSVLSLGTLTGGVRRVEERRVFIGRTELGFEKGSAMLKITLISDGGDWLVSSVEIYEINHSIQRPVK